MTWQRITKFDPRGARLADGHYSGRKVGSPQFMPPGETIILLTEDKLRLRRESRLTEPRLLLQGSPAGKCEADRLTVAKTLLGKCFA